MDRSSDLDQACLVEQRGKSLHPNQVGLWLLPLQLQSPGRFPHLHCSKVLEKSTGCECQERPLPGFGEDCDRAVRLWKWALLGDFSIFHTPSAQFLLPPPGFCCSPPTAGSLHFLFLQIQKMGGALLMSAMSRVDRCI